METTSAYWEAMIADSKARLPVTESEPQPGRYRMKNGAGWQPVAIWRDDAGAIQVMRGGGMERPETFGHVWVSCARHAITPTEYDRMASGEQNTDPVYAKLPTDPQSLTARVKLLGAIAPQVETPDDASRLADCAHVLRQIEKTCADSEKELLAPHLAGINRIKALWGEPAKLAKAAREPIMSALARYLDGKNSQGGVKGQLGKAISLRTDKTVEVTDYLAALHHFVEVRPEAFRALVEKLARAAVKAGETVEGVKEIETRRAQ